VIPPAVFYSEVLRSIHLDHELCPRRKEIHDVVADGLLPVELDAENLFSS
jgi:hypothetical protein